MAHILRFMISIFLLKVEKGGGGSMRENSQLSDPVSLVHRSLFCLPRNALRTIAAVLSYHKYVACFLFANTVGSFIKGC